MRNNFLYSDNGLSVRYEIFKKWRLNSDFSRSAYAGQHYVLLNTGIQRYFMAKNQLNIELKGFDLLNQNTNIRRVVTDTQIADLRTNSINQYVYLKLAYKIVKTGGGEM